MRTRTTPDPKERALGEAFDKADSTLRAFRDSKPPKSMTWHEYRAQVDKLEAVVLTASNAYYAHLRSKKR